MKVMICVDGSENSHRAFDRAVKLLQQEDEVFIINAVSLVSPIVLAGGPAGGMVDPRVYETTNESLKAEGRQIVDFYKKKCADLKLSNVQCHVIAGASAKDGISQYAKDHGIELLVVGSRGMGAVKRFFFGQLFKSPRQQCRVRCFGGQVRSRMQGHMAAC